MRRRKEVENIAGDGLCILGEQKEEAWQREEGEPSQWERAMREGNKKSADAVMRACKPKNFDEREKTLSVKSELGWTGLYFNMV